PIFLVAIFAPVIASNQPFVFHDGNDVLYPWWLSLFNPDMAIDFPFNMALLGFVPWLVLALATNWVAASRGVPGRRRLGLVLLEFVAILLIFCALFSVPSLQPSGKYWGRSFVQEEFESHSQGDSAPAPKYGIY